MKVSSKKVGLGIVALAVALMGSAAIADKAHERGMGGMHGKGGPMGGMGPRFDFAAADTDKDGKVTPTEFAAYRTAMVGDIDTDKDGKLSVEELTAMHMKGIAEKAGRMAAQMVQELDADADGKLSVAELTSMPVPPDAFDLADTNKDGVIDQAEADAAEQNMMHGPDDHRGHHGQHGPDDADSPQGGN